MNRHFSTGRQRLVWRSNQPRSGDVCKSAQAITRYETEGFGKLNIIGFETNLIGTVLGLQFSVITPGRVTLDGRSPLRLTNRLASPEGEISVESGLAGGLSILDGIVTFGYGRIRFDSREITNPVPAEKHSRYYYFNVQAISSIRSFIKAGNKRLNTTLILLVAGPELARDVEEALCDVFHVVTGGVDIGRCHDQ